MSNCDFSIMHKDLSEVLISEEELQEIVARVGREVTEHFRPFAEKGEKLLIMCVLKGSVVFFADLVRSIPLPLNLEFMKASSYGASTNSSGVVAIRQIPDDETLKDAHILVVEDILDTGNTLYKVLTVLKEKGAASVKLCTLLDKPSRRKAPISADFVGKEIPDAFVVGYGLDYDEKYRNLPYVGILKPEIYQ